MEIVDDNKREGLKDIFLEALKKSRGNVTIACRNIAYATSTVYKWRNDDAGFRAEWDNIVIEARDILADEAEDVLATLVRANNVTAVIFTLKNYRPEKWQDRYPDKGDKKGRFVNYDDFKRFCEQQGIDPATGLRSDTRVPSLEPSQQL